MTAGNRSRPADAYDSRVRSDGSFGAAPRMDLDQLLVRIDLCLRKSQQSARGACLAAGLGADSIRTITRANAPAIEAIEKLAQVLAVAPAYLIQWTDEPALQDAAAASLPYPEP